ncbi:hypothetical protein HFN68_35270 [Rhizobium laguerreae]|uniref:hypothetical protein n=1 Tax=Rhizobium laguerreae TaxID=1076926 RepID=UPI001C91297B|nr:hypothetical protein [Rhizobium laguerreae]MBY3538088.1 hypothetical protein [Rhizobium laguerreae]
MTASMIQPNEEGKKIWLDQIVKKSGSDVGTVRTVLERNQINARQTKAVPQRLTITSIAFSGFKGGKDSTDGFDFAWRDLGPGLWAVLSDANLRGKTTILNVVRWALTGRRSVREDMLPWFRTLKLGFVLDGRDFEVQVSDVQEAQGQLVRIHDQKERVVATFWDDPSFENAMSDFFMGELGLQPITNHADRHGKSVEQPHGWLWLYSSMLIEPNPVATFGSQGMAGMPTRMMQMFIGLPWANTTNDIKAAQGRLATKNNQATTLSEGIRGKTGKRIAELRERLTALGKLPSLDTAAIRRRLAEASDRFAKADAKVRALKLAIADVEGDAQAAKMAFDEARRALQALKESAAAGYVFRTLRPVCCPSCDEVFSPEHEQQRQSEHACVVCGTLETDGEDSSAATEAADESVKSASTESAKQQRRLAQTRENLAAAEAARAESSKECSSIEAELESAGRAEDPRLEMRVIDAQLQELEKLAGMAEDDTSEELRILDAAEQVTKSIYHDEQDRILGLVSKLAADYARKFGIEALDSLQINGAGAMRLVKRTVPTSFRAQTDGEKARLKVAAILAMLKVSDNEGVGRHPGLLLIDSPKSNEMIDKNYAMLMSGLAGLTDELKSLQIIFTGIAQPAVMDIVPLENRIHARDDDYLW